MSLNIAFALVTVLVTIYALIKRYETRCVLIAAGFAMAIFSLKPMIAFQQFDASMTKASLIIAICSAMGFAAAISLTKCDKTVKKFRRLSFAGLYGCYRHLRCGDPLDCRFVCSGWSFDDPDPDSLGL